MKHINMAEIQVLLFGILAEASGKSSLQIKDKDRLSDLQEAVLEQYPEIGKYKYRLAVNGSLQETTDLQLSDRDEVAFLPPFAGG